jgi:hypothetical protein
MVPGNAPGSQAGERPRRGRGDLNAPFSPASGTPWHPEHGGSRSLPMRTTLKWLAASAVILTAAQADAGEFLAPGPPARATRHPMGAATCRRAIAGGVYRSALLLPGPAATRSRRGHRRCAGRRRPATDPPRGRGARATAAACSGTGSATAAGCGRAASARGGACAARRRARRGQFARHYAGRGGGGARRLVRQPRRRAAVPEAAGEVGLPRGAERCANMRIDFVWPDAGDMATARTAR